MFAATITGGALERRSRIAERVPGFSYYIPSISVGKNVCTKTFVDE
jgi:hypothetical protein